MDGKGTIGIANSISTVRYGDLRKEVRNNGRNAILNRENIAASLEKEGSQVAAVEARKDAAVMLMIARKDGLKL